MVIDRGVVHLVCGCYVLKIDVRQTEVLGLILSDGFPPGEGCWWPLCAAPLFSVVLGVVSVDLALLKVPFVITPWKWDFSFDHKRQRFMLGCS